MSWPHGVPVVDAHVHLPRTDGMKPELAALLRRHPAFDALGAVARDPDSLLSFLDEQGIQQAWIITYNAPPMGYGRAEAEPVWELCAAAPERLVAVGGYEPSTDGDPEEAVAEMTERGVRVLKVHPVHQGIAADDARLDGLYEAAAARRMPVVFHTGPSVFPGADNDRADPAVLARVAARWPDLPVVVAHGGRPDRTEAALAVVREHPNAWLELSGCPPKRLHDYFGDLGPLADRVVWGSDWPGPGVPGPGANVTAFQEVAPALGLDAAAQRAVLHDNATRLLAAVRPA